MCGYCIEASETLEFVASERFSENVELHINFEPVYLQESNKFPEIVNTLKSDGASYGVIDIAFLRLWESLIRQEDNSGYTALLDGYGEDAIDRFLKQLKCACKLEKWGALANAQLYSNKENWARFAGNTHEFVEVAEHTLEWYLDWWLRSGANETDDSALGSEIDDAVENPWKTQEEDWDNFYSAFPFVYFSFLVLEKHQRHSRFIPTLALESPKRIPDFAAYDLWLQRRAFCVCVEEYGAQFVIDHYDDLRLELIGYSALRGHFSTNELLMLREHMLSHDHVSTDFMDTESVLKLIDRAVYAPISIH